MKRQPTSRCLLLIVAASAAHVCYAESDVPTISSLDDKTVELPGGREISGGANKARASYREFLDLHTEGGNFIVGERPVDVLHAEHLFESSNSGRLEVIRTKHVCDAQQVNNAAVDRGRCKKQHVIRHIPQKILRAVGFDV